MPEVTQTVHDHAVDHHWSANHTYKALMKLLLKPGFYTVVGGIPTIDGPRIAAHVEQQLFLRSGSTPSETWAGWKHGDWWLEYQYRVDGAQEPMGPPKPFGDWKLSREKADATLLPIDTDVRNARDRLNALKGKLGGTHKPADWPLRKDSPLYFRGSRAITVNLDGRNWVTGTGGMYMSAEEMKGLKEAAGWSDLGRGLVSWVWADTSGDPPPIEQIR